MAPYLFLLFFFSLFPDFLKLSQQFSCVILITEGGREVKGERGSEGRRDGKEKGRVEEGREGVREGGMEGKRGGWRRGERKGRG